MAKIDYKKDYKDIYLPKSPMLIEIPKMKYVMIDGKGEPQSENFQKAIQSLYTMSYSVKMAPRKGIEIKDYQEYTVFPLEGMWDLIDIDKGFNKNLKSNLKWTLMIRQPDFITEDKFNEIKELTKKVKKDIDIDNVYFKELAEGLCAQIMHLGSYDDEPATFSKLEEYVESQGYHRSYKTHKEIYISDFRKTEVDKLKTVLRIKINK